MENNNILIVDGDILNFTVGRATEDISDFGDQVCKSFDKESMIRLLENGLDEISKKTGYDRKDIIYSISDDDNFRKRFFPTYKGNRKKVVKPLGLKWLRDYLKENKDKYNLFMIPELEADDCMGIAGSGDKNVSIYSQDKDLKTIPCRQWDFKKKDFIHPTELESNRFLYTQVLTGDTVDGYGGCPRIGKVKAKEALRECKNELEMVMVCMSRFYKAYKKDLQKAKDMFLEQIGQARILHYLDYVALTQLNETFNPIKIMNISDDMLHEYCEGYIESLEKKKRGKKCSNVKAVKKK